MRAIGRMGISLALAIGAGVIFSASALAVEYGTHSLPEHGYCRKVAKGEGGYANSNCTKVAPEVEGHFKGNYEWTQLSSEETVAFSASGGATTLATASSAHTVKCSSIALSGSWSGPKNGTFTFELKGCTNGASAQCQSLLAEKGVIKSNELSATLGFVRNEVKEGKTIITVGVDLQPKSGSELATYECGSLTETAAIEGSVIAQIRPLETMKTESKLYYETVARSNKQNPEHFKGEPSDTLTTTFKSGVSSTSEATTLSVSKFLVGHNATAIEIKAREM